MSLIGLYNYDENLFSQLNLPNAISEETFINNLLYDCAELEVIYPDAEVMESAIGVWSAKQLPVWEHLYATTQQDYNMIYNYVIDGTTTTNTSSTDDNTSTTTTSTTNTKTNNLNEAHSGSDTNSGNTSITEDEDYSKTIDKDTHNIHKKASFETDTLLTENTDTFTDDTTESGSTDKTTSGTDSSTLTYGENIANTGTVINDGSSSSTTTDSASGSSTGTDDVYKEGMTGSYTPQMMIEQERELAKFNLMDYMIKDFKNRFCLLVY